VQENVNKKTAILLIFKGFRGKSGKVIYKKLTELLLFGIMKGGSKPEFVKK
jgi:hypothetical protein